MRRFIKIGVLMFSIFMICEKIQADEYAEVKRLQKEAIELFQKDEVANAYQKIDALYITEKGKTLDPILFNSNIIAQKSMDKYLSKGDKEELIISLAEPTTSEQAKIVAYMLWSQVEQERLAKQPKPEDLKRKITMSEGDLKMLEAELAFEEITQAQYDEKKNELSQKIALLKKGLQELEQKNLPTAAEMNEIICKKALNKYNFSTPMHDFLVMSIVHFYHRKVISGVGITPEVQKIYAQKCLENLALVKDPNAPRVKSFYDEFTVDALLALEKDIPQALKILDQMLQEPRSEHSLTRASLLLRKGNCMLITQNYPEAKQIANELQQMNIKSDPLKGNIAVFCKTAQKF